MASTIATPSPNDVPTHAKWFRRFSSLPAEIRELIWEYAAWPRIVHLELVAGKSHMCSRVWSETSIDAPEYMAFFDLDHQSQIAQCDQGPMPFRQFRSRQSIPALLITCKESCFVAKKKLTYIRKHSELHSLVLQLGSALNSMPCTSTGDTPRGTADGETQLSYSTRSILGRVLKKFSILPYTSGS